MPPSSGPRVESWATAPWDKADAYAIKAVAAGMASEAQQRRAIAWIMQASGLRDLSFRPDNTHATAFAEGKRFIGLQIAKLMELPAGVIEAAERAANRPKGRN